MPLEPEDAALRLVIAALTGALIGINRDIVQKPIGMRTLGLVALGSAMVTVASLSIPELSDKPDALSRLLQGVIQGVMAGISFIGAGVILRDARSGNVEGLTTAATVWVTAALGVACGLAAWLPVAVGTLIALLLLVLIGWVEALFTPKKPKD